ncbi:MAG: sulfite exporter TauE/SafE family protein [Clostridiales bacterium]|nr:sulfite exporter TauE/SafE family protein [Clostridiales bacterium]
MTPQHVIIIASALGGLIGGMGMGGGTLLIPLLTLAAGLEQHLAQSINLIAFVPLSVVALVIHKKNGYVCFKKAAPIAVVALIGAVCGSFGARYAGGYVLRCCFGAFLTALGVYQAVKAIVAIVKKHKEKKQKRNSGMGVQSI